MQNVLPLNCQFTIHDSQITIPNMTFKEIYDICIPENKRRDEQYNFFDFYCLRHPSVLMTIPLIKSPLSPTAVTKISVLCCLAGFGLVAFGGTMLLKVLGWVCFYLWGILDSVDGNLARVRNQCSKRGEVWDAIGGYLALVLIYFSAGIAAFFDDPLYAFGEPYWFLILGAATALCSIFHRLIYNRIRAIGMAPEVRSDFYNSGFNLVKFVKMNFFTVSGFFLVIFLLSMIFHVLNFFVTLYFVAVLGEMLIAMRSMLRGIKG